jgi:hypothetical protein
MINNYNFRINMLSSISKSMKKWVILFPVLSSISAVIIAIDIVKALPTGTKPPTV